MPVDGVDESWLTLPNRWVIRHTPAQNGEKVAVSAASGILQRACRESVARSRVAETKPRQPGEVKMGNVPCSGRLASRVGGFTLLLALSWGAVLPAGGPVCRAEEPRPVAPKGADPVAFLRVSRDANGEPEALETSVVRYCETTEAAAAAGRRTPLEVDLVGAVHVGSKSYYDTLDHLFRDYDSVLYELVAPDNARVPKPGRKASGAIGSAQQGMTQMLGLEHQLEQIDYTARNFVHADMSPKEFDAAMAKRGESWWSMFMKLMRENMARAERGQGQAGEVGFSDLFGIFFGQDRPVRLRRIMAEQFTDMEILTAAFGGEEGSSLITDRNGAAAEVLADQIKAGRRKVAIFYGAAHMEDFDRRLREDFQLEPVETTWIEAWDLRMR